MQVQMFREISMAPFARLAAVVATAAPLALAALPAAAAEPTERLIVVEGTARLSLPPDIATVTLGVVAEADTAAAALADNSAATGRLIAAIKADGVAGADIQTSELSVYPRYSEATENAAPRLVGYAVRNRVSVRLRALDRLGGLLDAAVKAGANEIDGIAFSVADADRRLDEARRAAVEDARRKAEIYAAAASIGLGPVVSIRETTAAGPPIRPMMRMAAADAVPVEAGEVELSVGLVVSYGISMAKP